MDAKVGGGNAHGDQVRGRHEAQPEKRRALLAGGPERAGNVVGLEDDLVSSGLTYREPAAGNLLEAGLGDVEIDAGLDLFIRVVITAGDAQ